MTMLKERREVTCRKSHACEWCSERIEVGERAFYRAYIWEGDFMGGYMHPECKNALENSSPEYVEYGFEINQFQRGKTAQECDA